MRNNSPTFTRALRGLLAFFLSLSLAATFVPVAGAQTDSGSLSSDSLDPGSLAKVLGSLGTPETKVEPPQPGASTELTVDPTTGAKTGSGFGAISLPQRQVTLADSEAEITVRFDTENKETLNGLALLSRFGYTSHPMKLEADPEAAAKGVTISRTYPNPIPKGALYSIVYYDEEPKVWVPVPTSISSDRRSITATVNHLSLWSDTVSFVDGANKTAWDGGAKVIEVTGQGFNAAGEKIGEAGNAIGGAFVNTTTTIGEGTAKAFDKGLELAGNSGDLLYKGGFHSFW